MFMLGLVLYIITVIGLLSSSSRALMYAFLVLGGISETGRYYVAYVYAIEIMPKRLQNRGGLAIFLIFATCKVAICLYFWQSSSKNWKFLGIVAICLATASLVLTAFFMPESPRFLHSKGQFEQAQRVLESVQRVNRYDLKYVISFEEIHSPHLNGTTTSERMALDT